MKTLALLVVVAIIAGVLWTREQSAKARRDEQMAAEMQAAEAARAAATPAPPSSRVVRVSPVNGDSRGATPPVNGGSRDATPQPSASREARKQFGWDAKGTALDKPAQR